MFSTTMLLPLRRMMPVLLLWAIIVTPALADDAKTEATKPPAVGETAADFALEDLDGEEVKLSELAADGPVVIVMLRGWPGYQCSICGRQVGELVGKAKALAKLDARVVLVYPGPVEKLTERAEQFLRGSELPENFTIVTDPGYEMTGEYHLRWDAKRETAYPSTFIVDAKLEVTFAKVSKGHGGRAKASQIIAALKK
jgi:peroxiredoxin Q/BCP